MVIEMGNILIVDDEELIRRSIRKKLATLGYVCSEAGDAHEALEKMKESPADLVILDIKMPGKSGQELLPEIKSHFPDTAVIMATTVTDTNVIIDCMKDGAQDYIPKPFNLNDVIQRVEQVLNKRNFEIEIKQTQQNLSKQVEEQTSEIQRLFQGGIEALVSALEANDQYTAGHSRRVTDLSVLIGKELGLSPDDLEDLRWGALLHDIGKIAVDPYIQNKPGRLTPDEYRHVMVHAQVGPGIVKPVVNEKISEIIKHHHARYDGTALDQIVRGEDVPLGARILAIADTYDAITSDRPYRTAASVEDARAEIERCSGTQFDPEVVAAFLRVPLP